MGLLIFYLLLALGISFLCSILEAVILSVTTSFIKLKENQGIRAAKKLHQLKLKIDRPLSAILSINTVAHTIGAAGVGAQAVTIFGETYFGLISAILTLLILIFSEIIPKTIGASYWRQLAIPSAKIIMVMVYVAYPLVVMSDFITKLFAGKSQKKSVSRDEIAILAQIGTKEGVFKEEESKVIHNVMRLNAIPVKDISTPRIVVTAVDETCTCENFVKDEKLLKFTRIPVFKQKIDVITGYVISSEVLKNYASGNKSQKIDELKRPVIMYDENGHIPGLFEKMLVHKEHIAIITDSYGGMQGIVSTEDIIETILGREIVDESDIEPDMQEYAKRQWKKRMDDAESKYWDNKDEKEQMS